MTAATARTANARSLFIARTYLHLLGAVLLFVAVEAWLFATGLAETIARPMLDVGWLVVRGAFMIVGWFASRAAHRAKSSGAQYAALTAFVLAKALLFVPLLFVAERAAPGVIGSAAAAAVVGFAALTSVAFATRRDFSFLRGFLYWGGLVALGLIVSALVFGFRLGPLFSVAMVGYAGVAILYDTSNVIRRFRPGREVAAALELFASVSLLLWYLVRLFMRQSRS